eukprot:58640_1
MEVVYIWNLKPTDHGIDKKKKNQKWQQFKIDCFGTRHTNRPFNRLKLIYMARITNDRSIDHNGDRCKTNGDWHLTNTIQTNWFHRTLLNLVSRGSSTVWFYDQKIENNEELIDLDDEFRENHIELLQR